MVFLAKDLRGLIDEGKKSLGSGVIAYIGVDEGKASLAVGVTDDLKAKSPRLICACWRQCGRRSRRRRTARHGARRRTGRREGA